MIFQIVGPIENIETIAEGSSHLLSKKYGPGRWKKERGTATVQLKDGSLRLAEVHWYEVHGIGETGHEDQIPFLRLMEAPQFVVCLDNTGYAASLEVGKPFIPDNEAEKLGGLRVIDADGEDYFYDAQMFCPLDVPPVVAQRLTVVSKQG